MDGVVYADFLDAYVISAATSGDVFLLHDEKDYTEPFKKFTCAALDVDLKRQNILCPQSLAGDQLHILFASAEYFTPSKYFAVFFREHLFFE